MCPNSYVAKTELHGQRLYFQVNTDQQNLRQSLSKKTERKNERIKNVVACYQEFKDRGQVLLYMRSVGYIVVP